MIISHKGFAGAKRGEYGSQEREIGRCINLRAMPRKGMRGKEKGLGEKSHLKKRKKRFHLWLKGCYGTGRETAWERGGVTRYQGKNREVYCPMSSERRLVCSAVETR